MKQQTLSGKDLKVLTDLVSFVFAVEQARKEHKVDQKKALQVLRKLYLAQMKGQQK